MKRIITKSIFWATALLLFVGINAEAYGVIEFSEPVMLDTTHNFSRAGSLGSTVYTDDGFICQGENCNLLLIETFQSPSVWAMARVDVSGNLIDTIPVQLFPPISEDSDWNMGIYKVFWSAPYFYVIGQLYYPGVPNSSTLAYLRIDENLEILDNPPVTFFKHIYSLFINLSIYADDLWMLIEENNEYYVAMYDLAADSLVIDSQTVSFSPRYFHNAADSNGLYISGKSRNTSVILNYFVDLEGNEHALDTIYYEGIESSIFNSYSILPYRHDSMVVAYFDIDSTDQDVLRYFFLDKTNSVAVPIEKIDVPFLPGDRIQATAAFDFDGDSLNAISNYQPFNEDDIGFYCFNPADGELLFADRFPGLKIPIHPTVGSKYYAFNCRANNGLYYYRDHGGVYQLKFDTSDPLNTYDITQILYNSDYYRMPTLAAAGDGLLLYTQYVDSTRLSFKGWRISDKETFSADTSFEFMMDSYLPYLPTLYVDDQVKALFWHEDVTATNPLYAADTTFEERIVVFEGDYPTLPDLQNQSLIETNKGHYRYKPDFVRLDSLLYFDILRNLSYAENSSCAGMGLRSVNINTGLMTPLQMDYACEGFPALVKWGDSLLSIRSNKYCTESNNIGCTAYHMNHASYVIYNDSVIAAYPLASLDFYFYPPYMDVTKSEYDNQYIFGLMAVDEIKQIYLGNTASVKTISIQPYCSSFYGYGGCDFVPVMTADYNAVIHKDGEYRVLLFDKDWNFIDSAAIPLIGTPIEFSEFVYLPEDDKIVFVYSSYIADGYFSTRLFMQSITCDIVTDIQDEHEQLPGSYSLSQNCPNPFNSSTVIEYTVPVKSDVNISIFNILGRKVRTLENKHMPAGTYNVRWDGRDNQGRLVSSGVYFYRIDAGQFVDSRKMILLK